jgi:sulfur relay (sulfurtransferase) complex TusBCD TusD component (DsrE family)
MSQLCLVVQTGPYTYQNLDTAYGLAKAALGKGHGVGLFLYIDGVVAANKNIDAPGERNLAVMLQELAADGVQIAPAVPAPSSGYH